ncbi:hypothetical protein SEUCBS140593_010685 [Sporothrix eucalyptigena]|uniref:Zn(2)-C6 fungal-type domain-containing protein n=1 Tax=Sporothrix eucalyptigena TaxID=1812306 RepID=A0ABP0D1Z7_9PEZI
MDAVDSSGGTAVQNGRAYRSKKQRPCDVCRFRRVQCKSLQQPDGSRDTSLCQMCVKLGLHCTFVQGPPRKRCRETVTAQAVPSDVRHPPTLPLNGAHNSQHAIAMDVEPSWFPSEPAALTTTMTTTTLEPDHLDMMHWWTTLETPPQVPAQGVAHAGLVPLSAMQPALSPIGSGSNLSASSVGDNRSPAAVSSGSLPHFVSGCSTSSTWPQEFSLESRPGHSHQLLGLSGESDPYFLRHYAYNEYDTYLMFRLHFRKVVDDALVPSPPPTMLPTGSPSGNNARPLPSSAMPVQFVIADEAIWRDDVHAVESLVLGNSTEETDTLLMAKLVSPELAVRLLKLYKQFVHPRYPVLSLHDLERMADMRGPVVDDTMHREIHDEIQREPPPESQVPREGWQSNHWGAQARPDGTLAFPVGLRCAVYALAAPFAFLDDRLSVAHGYRAGSTDELWAIAHRSFQRASRLSHLSSLQLCLLLLQQPPHSHVATEPPSFWALSCTSLAIAENLGLGLDPDTWRLPRPEALLRRRLWWLTHTTHVWQAIVCGRPLHIHGDDWDVAPLRPDDFDFAGESTQQISICIAECELGLIAADVLKDTLKETRRAPPALEALLVRAQPLRTRIERWRQTLPLLTKPASDLTEAEFEAGGAALRLSHLTLELLIFRALLRPLTVQAVAPADSACEPISTIFDNGYTCANAVAGMVASLQAKHFATFWRPCVRHQLCYVSTFLLMNLAQASTHAMAARYLALLDQWRRTLRIQARAWPLARLAAMRLDAITWKGVATVIHGAGMESPAMVLVRQQEGQQEGRQERL